MNEQQKEYLKRRRKQLAKKLQEGTDRKYTEALRQVKRESDLCSNCGEFIELDEVFGWYHGDIKNGWNTTCENDQQELSRAEPMLEG